MTAVSTDLDVPCPPPPAGQAGATETPARPPAVPGTLVAVRRPFDAIDPATWDALAAASPWATPFARWGVHRAWWDAYGANAHEQTLVVVDPAAPDPEAPVAIVPLMHRHEVEPDDAILRTRLRGDQRTPLTAVAPTAKAVFFGASYHADYATLLARPADLPAVAAAVAEALAASADAHDPDHPEPWDVVDLRRLRCGDPAAAALAEALGARTGQGWTVVREREEVCPVVTFEPGMDFEAYLGTLDKKERHEVRRKLRRAEAAGAVRLERSVDPVGDLDAFVDLHQKRWGAQGLFPPTTGGDQSRTFFRRLFELLGDDGAVQLHFLTADGRRIAAGVWFEDADAWYLYNAGVDPDARELSPGVLMSAIAIRAAIAAGRRRFDYLRGNEPYKYEWGAVDEPIQRLLVVRTGA
ncbi:MAG TPA: GNAT family N-acetyltransferase [Candidatus Nanopelagicales bacterium]|nr:GNAT family N-acetyltransferase [Candidatus Nanopelagicales bacterium]